MIIIVEDAVLNDVNATLSLLNMQIIRKLSVIPDPTPQTTPDYWGTVDMTADQTLVTKLQALCNGDLPQIDGQWGIDGVIEAATAQAAFSNGKVRIYSAAGVEYGRPFIDSILLKAGPGIDGSRLYEIPDEL